MVMDDQITYLCAHFREKPVIDAWEEAVKRICRGDCPHAEQVVAILLQKRLEPIRVIPDAATVEPPRSVSSFRGFGGFGTTSPASRGREAAGRR